MIQASRARPDTGQQLLEYEGLRELSVGPAVEREDLVVHVVAGGEHQHRQVGTLTPDAAQHLVPVELGQPEIQQHEAYGVVDGERDFQLAVLGADTLVAVGGKSALQRSYATLIVLYCQKRMVPPARVYFSDVPSIARRPGRGSGA